MVEVEGVRKGKAEVEFRGLEAKRKGKLKAQAWARFEDDGRWRKKRNERGMGIRVVFVGGAMFNGGGMEERWEEERFVGKSTGFVGMGEMLPSEGIRFGN
ncbi:hypothetical protein ACH5RR_029353 [Cinchona calisaya]|uniref:Uncharacterized protein n=1 Tax=Cinchona calisaya TaxID=153742 RepID=A0ABD2YRE9_9GENT